MIIDVWTVNENPLKSGRFDITFVYKAFLDWLQHKNPD